MAEGTPRAFWNALYMGDVDVITEHLENDDVNLDQGDPDCGNETPLMRLCHTEIGEDDIAAILELMLMKKPDVNVQDREGRTVLCHACMSGQTYIIQRLSALPECDPNIPDCYGNTPLMFGVYYGDVHVLESLLSSFGSNGPGVNISARNDEDITATMIAEQYQYHDIADYLQQYLAWTIAMMEAHDKQVAEAEAEQQIEQPQQAQSSWTDEGNTQVGGKTQNFRRRKLKHALGPLVVQNKLQTSKSADYSKHHDTHMVSVEISPRQYSYSAGTQQPGGNLADKLYRQTEVLQDDISYDDDEFEDISDYDGESDEENNDDVFNENEKKTVIPTSRARINSNSLPDLTNKKKGKRTALVALKPLPDTTSRNDGYCDSGYDTRSSQCTVSREELLLPNLPEGGCDSDNDYTPRTRRGSFSLPDLRGVKHSLVARVTNTNSTPRLTDLGSNSSTPRRSDINSKDSTPSQNRRKVPGLQQDDLKYIQDFITADYQSDTSSEPEQDCEETLKFNDVCTARDISFKLPVLGEINNSVVSTPRVAIKAEKNGATTKLKHRGNTAFDNKRKLGKLASNDQIHVTELTIQPPKNTKVSEFTGANTSRSGNISLQSPRITRRTDAFNNTPRATGRPKHRQNVLLDHN